MHGNIDDVFLGSGGKIAVVEHRGAILNGKSHESHMTMSHSLCFAIHSL